MSQDQEKPHKSFWRILLARIRRACDVFLDHMALGFGIERKKKPEIRPKPKISPACDTRVRIPAHSGAPFESVGMLLNVVTRSSGSCVYQGDGFALSAAHCFNEAARGISQDTLAAFHWKTRKRGKQAVFKLWAGVMEIAIPENYMPVKDGRPQPESLGYDIAFLRLAPLVEKPFPKNIFPLKDRIDSLKVAQAGYNGDRINEGLTGAFNRSILPLIGGKVDYIIHTDCPAVRGSSGSPLLEEGKKLIGIMESVSMDDEGVVIASRATPITPGLREAFERFKNGALEGRMEKLPNGIKLIRFPYVREPVLLPLPKGLTTILK